MRMTPVCDGSAFAALSHVHLVRMEHFFQDDKLVFLFLNMYMFLCLMKILIYRTCVLQQLRIFIIDRAGIHVCKPPM